MDIKIAVKSHILITIHCLGLGAGVDLLGLINGKLLAATILSSEESVIFVVPTMLSLHIKFNCEVYIPFSFEVA